MENIFVSSFSLYKSGGKKVGPVLLSNFPNIDTVRSNNNNLDPLQLFICTSSNYKLFFCPDLHKPISDLLAEK